MQKVSKWTSCLIALLLLPGLTLVRVSAAAQQAHVTVTVTDKDGKPVPSARVFLARRDSYFFDIFTGDTAADGVAHVGGLVHLGGVYDVDVFSSETQPGHATLTINKFSDTDYKVSIEVAHKPGARITTLEAAMAPEFYGRAADESRMMYIRVIGRQPDGSTAPIPGATVFVPGEGGRITNENGVVGVQHNYVIGTQIGIVATASGYESAEGSCIIGRGGTALTSISDSATITLTKISASAGTPMIIEFEVLDHDSDKPVAGARVFITRQTPGTSTDTPSVRTDGQGKAQIRLDPSDLTGTYTAKVNADKYDPKWSEINRELLTPSDTPRSFTVYLKPGVSGNQSYIGTWEAPYHNGKAVLVITESGSGPMNADSTDMTNGKPSLERGKIWNGKVQGNQYVLMWESTYSDGDKSITRGGTATCTLSGDKLIVTSIVDPKTLKEDWHVGRYSSGAERGGTGTYTRAK